MTKAQKWNGLATARVSGKLEEAAAMEGIDGNLC
jgi:hypothetical protein